MRKHFLFSILLLSNLFTNAQISHYEYSLLMISGKLDYYHVAIDSSSIEIYKIMEDTISTTLEEHNKSSIQKIHLAENQLDSLNKRLMTLFNIASLEDFDSYCHIEWQGFIIRNEKKSFKKDTANFDLKDVSYHNFSEKFNSFFNYLYTVSNNNPPKEIFTFNEYHESKEKKDSNKINESWFRRFFRN